MWRSPLKTAVFVCAMGIAAAGSVGCENVGADVPSAQLNFPLAMRLSGDGAMLYVANSNFDLRFRQGSFQVYDLDALGQAVDSSACGQDDATQCSLIPTQLAGSERTDQIRGVPVDGLLRAEVRINSYAASINVIPHAGGDRVYVPVRAASDIYHFDVAADGSVSCDAAGDCDPSARTGASDVGFEDFPTDPIATEAVPLATLGANIEGNAIVVAHRAGGVSLLIDRLDGGKLRLADTGSGGLSEHSAVAFQPTSKEWVVSSALDGAFIRLGTSIGASTVDPAQSQLLLTGRDSIRSAVGGVGLDIRDVAVDPRPAVDQTYFLTRSPRSLLTAKAGQLPSQSGTPVRVGRGASRLAVATMALPGGGERTLAFVSCFDDDEIDIIDVDDGRVVGVMRGLGSPFAFATDPVRGRLYVGDFRTSVIRVVGLAPLLSCLAGNAAASCSPTMEATLGYPQEISELQ